MSLVVGGVPKSLTHSIVKAAPNRGRLFLWALVEGLGRIASMQRLLIGLILQSLSSLERACKLSKKALSRRRGLPCDWFPGRTLFCQINLHLVEVD